MTLTFRSTLCEYCQGISAGDRAYCNHCSLLQCRLQANRLLGTTYDAPSCTVSAGLRTYASDLTIVDKLRSTLVDPLMRYSDETLYSEPAPTTPLTGLSGVVQQ